MTAYTATVTVRLKRGVLDPEAETTQQALALPGFALPDLLSAARFDVALDSSDPHPSADRADAIAGEQLG